MDLDDARLLGIEIVIKNNNDEIKLLFVNIYMPFDCADNTDDFMQYLSRVNDICETYPTPYVYVIGDFTANVTIKNQCSKFGDDGGILMADYDYLPKDSYTFTSSAHNTVSWLDHILTTSPGRDLIEHIDTILYLLTNSHYCYF